ncbi:MAG: DUF3795 domain-containing protein [Promethearchaeota archaeon]
MVEIIKELLAPCGLYCGACRVFISFRDNNLKLKQEILPFYQAYGAETVDDIVCTGCLSEGIIFKFCQTCLIKECIVDKKVEGCRECDEFPCSIIKNWPSPVGKKVMLRAIPRWRELGTEKWVEEEENRYVCPKCGTSLFRGALKCNNCNSSIKID